ncbi:class II fructose-bisphosphatase [Sporosarcina sp. ANT_H38]|uniref:class II fructose-bisphosphatase n=1 Tax=Sporosarcina sp. ANT_H38 TaxID=2597358 RepID=UPI0011F0F096|nr:class II fructose-bisphosphatase [Sporosarcina sp. ANT_H38]KAA0966376.1 class II fructose-bisphosphatase [Sporosarcina sp. ANT_H38]
MKEEVQLALVKTCEQVAIDAYHWIGMGDKAKIDLVAVEAIRTGLNKLNVCFEIVIGEGEIDDAPMLYEGERLGNMKSEVHYDVAVDPIECTSSSAKGIAGAITVMALAQKGRLFSAPDMYMEKIMVGPNGKGAIDLTKSLEENIMSVAKKLGKKLHEMTIIVLDKPRHTSIIQTLRSKGIRVFTPPEGDVIGGLQIALEKGNIDLLYGIGGAPEGVISAVALKALGGEMNAKLLFRSQVKGATPENEAISIQELKRCLSMGIDVDSILTLDDLVGDNEAVFIATGITNTEVLQGVIKQHNQKINTHSLLLTGKDNVAQYIATEHSLTSF